MFRVSAPLLSRQWTPGQLAHFRKQREISAVAKVRRRAQRPKYMPSWTRHDIWLDEASDKTQKKTLENKTQNTQQADAQKQQKEQKQQKQQPTPTQTKETTQPTQEKQEEKKSMFKFW